MLKTAAVAFAVGLAAGDGNVLMEHEVSSTTRGLPEGWKSTGRSSAEHGIELLFAVKQSNLPQLESILLAVSDPRSSQYGKHLSNEKVHALVAPQARNVEAVKTFLASHSVEGVAVTSNADFIRATVTVAQAEAMLDAKYFSLQHTGGKTVHRTMNYTLPAEVANAVDFVSPTVHIPKPQRKAVKVAPELGVNSPKKLRELYSIDREGQAANNKMAVTGFLEQYYSESDLKNFWGQFCDGITCGKGLPELVGDATNVPRGEEAGVESMLDIETITGIAGNITSAFWGFEDTQSGDPFLKWLAKVSTTSDADVPKVFSTSYGEDEDGLSKSAATRLNTEFQKAGVRGISLLYASGDEGANCERGTFKPQSPGSSPWVTAVGGTTGTEGDSAVGLSSGGFSDYWPMPDWQKSAVSEYLTQDGLPKAKYGYNTAGRAYPDIAAQATNFRVVANGANNDGIGGTSCASPAAAGVIALLNDALLLAGKPPLGFLNPWIYQNRDAWNDIMQGSSTGGCLFGGGWPAKSGWDASTGLGSPNFAKLLETLGL